MHLQVVNTLTDGTVPSPNLVSTIKRLYDTKLKVIMDNVLYLYSNVHYFCPNKDYHQVFFSSKIC